MLTMFRRFRRWGVIGALLLGNAALAQPSGADGEYFLYRVMQGDTLLHLATRYTTGPDNWPYLQQINQVEDTHRLPIARLLRIPFSMIPEQASSARVVHLTGDVQVDGQRARADQLIHEGQLITTGKTGFMGMVLSDDSVLSVPPASQMRLVRLREFQGTGLLDLIVDMTDGSLESDVAPKDTGVGRFEVRTPVSVTGVRGTRVRIHASDSGARSEVLSGQAHVAADQSAGDMLRQQQGVVVDASGRSTGPRSLLPAPQLSVPQRGANGWQVDFPAIEGAQAYLVRVSEDAQGYQLVSSTQVAAGPVSVHAPGAGTYYVSVRAVDAAGLGGLDASQAFEGRAVLLLATGGMVGSAYAGPVVLNDY